MAKLTRDKIPFTQIANEILNDPTLSLRAKGLYSYLFSKPEEWDFESKRIAMYSSDGRDAVRASLKELEDHGYLARTKLPNGRMVYALKHSINPEPEKPSLVEKPMPEKANDGNTQRLKSRPISNKDTKLTKNINNNLSEAGAPQVLSKEISEAIESFNLINDNYTKWYKNTTQRKATAELIEKYTLRRVLKSVYMASFCYKDKYFPNFTSPHELLTKWSKVIKYYKVRLADKRFIDDLDKYIIQMESQKGGDKNESISIAGLKFEYEITQ